MPGKVSREEISVRKLGGHLIVFKLVISTSYKYTLSSFYIKTSKVCVVIIVVPDKPMKE